MPTPNRVPRYRVEGGKTCIDIQLRSALQLFDGRDPAPFRERDLDEDAVDYLLAAAEEIRSSAPLKVVVQLQEPPAPRLGAHEIEQAIQSHFEHEQTQIARRLRQQRQLGHMALAAGLGLLVVLLTGAQLTDRLPPGNAREILREGLTITGWVAMWKPIEVLLYDWWPLARTRRQIARILRAEVEVLVQGRPATAGDAARS